MSTLLLALCHILICIGLSGLTLMCGYLWALAAVRMFHRCDTSIITESDCQTRFAVVVPAHNEAKQIADTVASLKKMLYCSQLFEIVVVADNCDDKTADIARKESVRCLERFDTTSKGKGFALRYAFEELLPEGYDALVVVDADTEVEVNFLAALDLRIRNGQKVVQVHYGLSNPDESVLTYLFQVGNVLENLLFWAPKDKLGLPVVLRGNGMCFTRDILERFPWHSFSIVEDTEYALHLLEQQVRIHFATETAVYARQPWKLRQAHRQRVRWSSGNAVLTRSHAWQLIRQGIASLDLWRTDLALTLIANSKPLLLVGNLALVALSFPLGGRALSGWAMLLLLSQVLYIGLGIVMAGLSPRKIGHLICSPFYLVWLCCISVVGLAGYRKTEWLRTGRE